jgi:DNA-binding MarR family transcriptional regulator/N-acetylglutamate synthase-like GNAT family acetyltransferase
MDTLRDVGSLGLASRLKRISDGLFKSVEEIYEANSIALSPRAFSVLYALSIKEKVAVTELATMLRLSHPAIVQQARELEAVGYAQSFSDKSDGRRTLLSLTKKGTALLKEISPIWDVMRSEIDNRIKASGQDLLQCLSFLEDSFQSRPLSVAVLNHFKSYSSKRAQEPVIIEGWSDTLKSDFEQLNVEWLSEYGFSIEDKDKTYFSDPRSTILNKGGAIFFARHDSKIIGTCALLVRDDGSFELAKMGVSKSARGLGAGEKLAREAIKHAQAKGLEILYLETNSKLKEAIKLYKKLGFVEIDTPAHYERVDVTMKLDLSHK